MHERSVGKQTMMMDFCYHRWQMEIIMSTALWYPEILELFGDINYYSLSIIMHAHALLVHVQVCNLVN